MSVEQPTGLNPFQVGDVVRLNSGGCEMTILNVVGEVIRVGWFYGDGLTIFAYTDQRWEPFHLIREFKPTRRA